MRRQVDSNWRKHRPRDVTGAQLGALQAAYKSLVANDDPRVQMQRPRGDERADRLAWASWKLGRPGIRSFSDLTLQEATYLLDYCNAGRTKLDIKIDAEFERLGVIDRIKYFDSFLRTDCQSKLLWKFGGRSLNELNRLDKINLVQMLIIREPGPTRESSARRPSDSRDR